MWLYHGMFWLSFNLVPLLSQETGFSVIIKVLSFLQAIGGDVCSSGFFLV